MDEKRLRNFASDNHAGICPQAWRYMEKANRGHAPAYGEDPYTREACDLFRDVFETDCEVYFNFNGTAANSLAIAAMCQSYHSVICHKFSHVETDECGGPEFFTGGSKILRIPGEMGKVTPDGVEQTVNRRKDLHFPKARVLSLTQSTELGTVYTVGEIEQLGAMAKKHGLKVHMDGARFANAMATLQCSPKEITWQAGVDVLCFGGTKNGLAVGEALLFFDEDLSREFEFRCKQAGQLCSKMRYISAPWLGLLKDEVWVRNGAQANRCAQRLREGLNELGISILFPVETNCAYAQFDERVMAGMFYRGWKFYDFKDVGGCRLMCSWDTTFEDVDAFLADVGQLLESDEDRRGQVEIARH